MTSTFFFVLGSQDHEMREIERVCQELGFNYGYAKKDGHVVKSFTAYSATGIVGKAGNSYVPVAIPAGSKIVCVECAVMGLRPDEIIDHHNPGDAGYGKAPKDFYEGSSLGQFLRLIGMEPTQRQRVIAAADHCLSAAYRGECPGITLEELTEFREQTRAQARRMSREDLQLQIEHSTLVLRHAERVNIAGIPVAWFDSEPPPTEASEASARLSQPYVAITKRSDGRIKAVIKSAPAKVVEAWLALSDLAGTYGDAQRGFAGGYFR